ncbi:MAG: transposase family protein, partial [Spirochaetaceae bacterium]|nr:transposase family protein [Spirochaetaceae bacterium]
MGIGGKLLIGKAKMSLEIREKAEGEILRLKTMTELPLPMLLAFAGIPERTWREWQGRRGLETKHNNNIPRCYYLTPEEEKVILHFCQNNCAVHEQWHIDFSYIKICGSFFYFVSILDGYSRLILNWRLCDTMEGVNAELLVMETKELYREAKNPRLISDKRG